MIALVIFAIGFSGLYFFFAAAQKSADYAEKRMYLNLMADRIVETIASESRRVNTDPSNPFVTPTLYSGSLTSCDSSLSTTRQSWCVDLVNEVGSYNPASGVETRLVSINVDSSGLIVNVSFVIDSGKVRTYYSRKIRQAI